MSLFPEKKEEEISPFDKEGVIKEIIEFYQEEVPEWYVIRAPDYDLLAIRSIRVSEKIVKNTNPFSIYESVLDKIYQVCIWANVDDNKSIMVEPFTSRNLGREIKISSADQFFKYLKDFVNK